MDWIGFFEQGVLCVGGGGGEDWSKEGGGPLSYAL